MRLKNKKTITENQLVDKFKKLLNEAPPMSFGQEVGGAEQVVQHGRGGQP